MQTNSAADLQVQKHVEWFNYERLPPPARKLLQDAHANFPSHEIAYLLRSGHTYKQIADLMEADRKRICRQTYGADHPGV
jgi:hypothetical protein